jgi:hypothetical protein
MAGSRIDRQMEATAMLAQRLAEVLPLVRDHVVTELATARVFGGWSSHTAGASLPSPGAPSKVLDGPCHRAAEDDPGAYCPHDRPCPVHDRPVTLTSVERAAEEALRIQRWYADITQSQKLVAVTLADALRNCEKLLGMRISPAKCDATGREGYLVPRAEGGWSDLACEEAAEKSGLCVACYFREYRWRKANDLPTRDRTELDRSA